MENEKQLILADADLNDILPVMDAESDIAVGEENTFEVKIPRGNWDDRYTFGTSVYIKNTEYGGIIGEVDTSTSMDTISLLGYTWRGYLDKKIIEPPEGEDYYTVSGELNAVIAEVVGDRYGKYMSVSSENTGKSVRNYKFERYCKIRAGIEKMLQSVGYKLAIKYIQREHGQPGYVELSATPIADYSEEIELSQDSQLNFNFKNIRNGVNHLICLGKGELQERQVIHLYVQANGNIGHTQYYTGIEEIAEIYEDTSSESDELEEKGIEKLKESMNRTAFSMNVESLGINVDIGDLVGGRDYLTGLYAKKPIKSKIYKVKDGETSIEYGVEGDDE